MTSNPYTFGASRMGTSLKKALPFALVSSLLVAWLCTLLPAHESPLDVLTRTLRFWVQGDQLFLRYEEKVSERSALLELHAMDRNRDGIVQDEERDMYLGEKARKLVTRLHLRVAETPLTLTARGPVALRRGWRQIHDFQVSLAALPRGVHTLQMSDDNARMRPGQVSWTIGSPEAPGKETASRPMAKLSSKPRSGGKADLGDSNVLEFILEIPEGTREGLSPTLPDKTSTRNRSDPKDAGGGK